MPDRKLLFALFLASCVSSAEIVSFDEDVLPILNKYCVMCHLPGAEQADLVLYPDAWTELVGIPSSQSALSRVEPGSPDKSYLYLKLIDKQETGGGSGLQMPIQQSPLAPAQLEAIRLWIEQGARKN
jgi:hypothetical protein